MSDAIALVPIVKIGGMPLPADWKAALVEIRVECQYQVPARLVLRFSDPGYTLASTDKAKLGAGVTVASPTSEATLLIDAEVTAVALEQRVGDHPELVVTGHDKSHRLGRATDVKTYLEMTYSDVVSTLASGAGLIPATEATTLTVDYLMQADSGLGLLTELARRVGYDWWVDDGSLHFKKPAAGSSVSLALGTSLLAFSAKASGHHPDSVTVEGWDRDQQKLVSATKESASTAVKATSDFAELAAATTEAFGSAKLLTAGLSAHSDAEASELAQAVLDRAVAASVVAQGVAVGNPALKLGVSAEVTGAGPLSGKYPVTRVEHLFRPASGFVTRFHAGDRRPATLVDTLGGGGAAATPATVHPGLSVGKVTNANDPKSGGRVKVKYPGLSSEYETGWARVVALGGGNNRGAVFTPEVDDEVLVAFEGGDPRQPVVVGGLFGSSSKIPTPQIQEGVVQQRGLMSRLGHKVYLLDGDDPAAQAVVIQLAGGEHTIHLGKDKLSIAVPTGLPVEITAGGSSIKFADSGALTISAPQITIKADAKISLQGATIEAAAEGQLSLQSDGQAGLKGAVVQIQSEGPLSAQGEPVSIN